MSRLASTSEPIRSLSSYGPSYFEIGLPTTTVVTDMVFVNLTAQPIGVSDDGVSTKWAVPANTSLSVHYSMKVGTQLYLHLLADVPSGGSYFYISCVHNPD